LEKASKGDPRFRVFLPILKISLLTFWVGKEMTIRGKPILAIPAYLWPVDFTFCWYLRSSSLQMIQLCVVGPRRGELYPITRDRRRLARVVVRLVSLKEDRASFLGREESSWWALLQWLLGRNDPCLRDERNAGD